MLLNYWSLMLLLLLFSQVNIICTLRCIFYRVVDRPVFTIFKLLSGVELKEISSELLSFYALFWILKLAIRLFFIHKLSKKKLHLLLCFLFCALATVKVFDLHIKLLILRAYICAMSLVSSICTLSFSSIP